MDSALKQMIAIGLICALIGGIVGGLAVSLLDDSPTSDGYAYVEITIKGPNPNAPDISKDISVFSTKAGTVDIFIKNRSRSALKNFIIHKNILSSKLKIM